MFKELSFTDAVVILSELSGVIVYPTETSYALGCDATNPTAVSKIFSIKGRDLGKGLPLILPPDSDPAEFIEFNELAQDLALKYWPGPLNIISQRTPGSKVVTACETLGTQSVRKSSHHLAAKLAAILGCPLVATSANKSGQSALYSLANLLNEFSEETQLDGYLNVGELPVTPASTTVIIKGKDLEVVRQGSIII